MTSPITVKALTPADLATGDDVMGIQGRLIMALGDSVADGWKLSQLGTNPISLRLKPPLPTHARAYTYRATAHESERDKAAWKIQLTTGTRGRGSRNHFDWSDAHMVYLLGSVPGYDVWIVFDAEVQEGEKGFAYSKSCYVDRGAVELGGIKGLVQSTTRLKGPARDEVALLATPSQLPRALEERFRAHLRMDSTR
jgi:hypothetical protein